jgi:hypothetical protein
VQLNTFTPPVREDGDRVPAKEMAGRPLVVLVREHRFGIKTQFNSNPADTAKYKPEGGEAVVLDIADLTSNTVYINVLWFNGAIVDSLKGYVSQMVPVKLFYDTPKTGTNAYLNVEPLTGAELATAQAWAAANPERFERERVHRTVTGSAAPAAPNNGGMAPIPGAPSQPPPWAAPSAPPAPPVAPPLPATPVTAPHVPPAAPAVPPAPAGINVNDPAVQALLAQLAAQQQSGV